MHEEFMKFLKSFEPGEIITKENCSENKDFFCLLQGKVGVWKNSPEKSDKSSLIREIEDKGAYFGEISALLNEPRTATIKAISKVKVLQFPGQMLPLMMNKQPKLAIKLATALAVRLKATTTKQQDFSEKSREIQQDSTQQLMQARETIKKLFILLSATQMQYQLPPLKEIIKWLTQDKLFFTGRSRFNKDPEFIKSLPNELQETVNKFFAAQESK